MLATTKTAMSAILNADPSITPEQRKAVLMAALSTPAPKAGHMPRIIRRQEASALLGVGVKRIDQLSRAGILKRVTIPGTSRAIGLSEASVRAVTEGGVE